MMTESVSQLEINAMTNQSHKTTKSNYFSTWLYGTRLVKRIAGDTCRQRLVMMIRSFVMKRFTDHFSFVRKTISLFLLTAFVLTNVVAVQVFAGGGGTTKPASAAFTTDLTQLGREGRLRQSPNFETTVNQVVEVLEKGGSSQPVIVDENGSVQDEIVEQIAIRIA